jgi:photosystem II stability/assembly factor-like uncharacterized protein
MSDKMLSTIAAADPVRSVDFSELCASPVFTDLAEAIVAGDIGPQDEHESVASPSFPARSGSTHSTRQRVATLVTVAATVVVLATALTIALGGSSSNSKVSLPVGARVTPWHAARKLPVALHPATSTGSVGWQLVSLVANQGWQVDTSGAPPSELTCPAVSICYGLSVRYASPKAGAKPGSVSLYTSSDLGSTWSVLPMPSGFLPISNLSCTVEGVCGVGGTEKSRPAFALTIDGGHQWGVVSMPGTDLLRAVDCQSATICIGVLREGGIGGRSSSIVRTSDGGATWASPTGRVSGLLLALSCSAAQECVAVGATPSPGMFDDTGLALRSDDGGVSWTQATLPSGFGFSRFTTAVSCASAGFCMALGATSIPNPTLCQGPNGDPPPGFDYCSTSPTTEVSAVVTSSDGGNTWRLRPLPSNVPMPQLFSVSCAGTSVCWAAGQESVPQVIGNVHDDGSPVMVGTTDGGATWTKSTFVIPANAPNYLGQEYLAISDISCPTASECVASGAGAQSAPSTPIYRYQEGSPTS